MLCSKWKCHNPILFQLAIITFTLSIQYNNLSAQMDVLHYDRQSFTTATILKTSDLRNESFKNLKHQCLSTSLLHISTPITYHVYEKFKDPLKIYQVISKSHKIESHLNFIRFSIIKSFSIITFQIIISISSCYAPIFLLLNPFKTQLYQVLRIYKYTNINQIHLSIIL